MVTLPSLMANDPFAWNVSDVSEGFHSSSICHSYVSFALPLFVVKDPFSRSMSLISGYLLIDHAKLRYSSSSYML